VEPPPPPAVAKEPTPLESILETKDVNKALAVMKPLFKDVSTDEPADQNAFSFAIWADANLTWKDLGALPFMKSTATFKKDPDLERAKYFCFRSSIIQIARVPGKYPIYSGLMGGRGRDDVVDFLAVHSTGELVEKSQARFCGIVTGKHSYRNSGGGSTHAIQLVGMFDLPENRTFGALPAPTVAH
jgi:hypothetical protein